jgi:hypothetical protein
MTPQQAALLRSLLHIIGTALAAHGAVRAAAVLNAGDTVEFIIGLATLISGFVTSYAANSTKAIQQKAADSLPPNTVLPATTDAAPKAQPMTPESATDFIRKPQN